MSAPADSPHIVLLCATHRGERVLERIATLVPHARLTVVSFREESWEPPFFERIGELATRLGASFHESRTLQLPTLRAELERNPPDLLIAVSWRYMVSDDIRQSARLGAFLFHDSLLPRYRGFAPTRWAMLNGERETGVTLLEMAAELDRGRILDQLAVPIAADESIGPVMERVTDEYLSVMERNLPALLKGGGRRTVQDESQATYGCRRMPEDDRIDWSRTTEQLHNLIRASSRPYPGAFTYFEKSRLTVWTASRSNLPRYTGTVPGRIAEIRSGEGVIVLTGDGALLLREVQLEGRTACRADEVLTKFAATLGADR